MLGFDPLYVANEGKLLAFVGRTEGDRILEAMRDTRYGEEATVIGEVVDEAAERLLLRTAIGSQRAWTCRPGSCCPVSVEASIL